MHDKLIVRFVKDSPFLKLRTRMFELGIDQDAIADEILRCRAYVNPRMTGRKPWPMDEAYAILDFLKVPREQIFEFFPPLPKAKSHKRKKSSA